MARLWQTGFELHPCDEISWDEITAQPIAPRVRPKLPDTTMYFEDWTMLFVPPRSSPPRPISLDTSLTFLERLNAEVRAANLIYPERGSFDEKGHQETAAWFSRLWD